MVQYCVCRVQSLSIIQQLILSSGGDEDLASLLGMMHTSAPNAIQLKMDIIKVISCLFSTLYHLLHDELWC